MKIWAVNLIVRLNHSRWNTFFYLKHAYLKPMGYLLISESLWDFTQEIWISVLLSSLSPPKRDVFNKESAVEEYHFFMPRCYKKVFSRVYEGFKSSESITKYISNVYVENLLTYSYEKTTIAWVFLLFPQNKGRKWLKNLPSCFSHILRTQNPVHRTPQV